MVTDLYSPASEPGVPSTRFNNYYTGQQHNNQNSVPHGSLHHHPQIHGAPAVPPPLQQNNGTLRRTQAPKLQFPKDYIRNGSMTTADLAANGGMDSMHQHYNSSQQQPSSPTHTVPGGNMGQLSSFSRGNIIPTSTLPIEQRGHLV